MASIRTRTWRNQDRSITKKFELDYYDIHGERTREHFDTKAEALERKNEVERQKSRGIFISDKHSLTVAEAADKWLEDFERKVKEGKREYSTLFSYQYLVKNHIKNPAYHISQKRLTRLTPLECQDYINRLQSDTTDANAVKTLAALRMIITYAQKQTWVAQNVAKLAKVEKVKTIIEAEDPDLTIPSREDLAALLHAAEDFEAYGFPNGFAAAFFHTALFTGMRASELLALDRPGVKLDTNRPFIMVRKKLCTRTMKVGSVKTRHAIRNIPIGPKTAQVLRQWVLRCPPNDQELIFPNANGGHVWYRNFRSRLWYPLHDQAGMIPPPGRKRWRFHDLRDCAASIWIEQEITPKQLQKRMGHHSVKFTLDVYGHLFKNRQNDDRMAESSERFILG